jgi:hypothetical protein
LFSFVGALAILVLMLYQAERLVRLGLIGNLYYVVLVPLGLCVAAFLFGTLKSRAVYRGQALQGNLALGGPIVGFLSVVLLGFFLVPNARPFNVTVFVHGEAGVNDLVLRNRGEVMLDLGGDRRRAKIGDEGQAYFAGIPSNFHGQSVKVLLQADGVEPANAAATILLDREDLYLAVKPKTVRLKGSVIDMAGQGIAGADVRMAGHSTTTDDAGAFILTLPDGPAEMMQISAPGYSAWRTLVEPAGNPIAAQLQKENQKKIENQKNKEKQK